MLRDGNIVEIPVVQEHVIVSEILPVVERIQVETIDVISMSNTSTSQFNASNSSSTSTNGNHLDQITINLNQCLEQLIPLADLNEGIEKFETLTKRLLELLLPDPPIVEPFSAMSSAKTPFAGLGTHRCRGLWNTQ